MGASTKVKYLALPTAILFGMMFISFAGSAPIGVGFVTLNQTHLSLYKNTTTYINFKVTLYNGTAGNTTMGVTPLPPTTSLLPNGVNIGFTNSSGVPPFGGQVVVTIAANAVPGNYTAGIETGGADNSRHGFPTMFITVYSTPKPVTTTAPTTTISPTNTSKTTVPTSVSTVPTTTTTAPIISPTVTASTAMLYYIIIAALVIVIIAILVYLAVRRR